MSTNYPLPGAFAGRMREQLGPSAGAYFAALERPYLRGLRLNPRYRRACSMVPGSRTLSVA